MSDLVDVNENEPVFACNMAAIDSTQLEGHIANTTQLLAIAKFTEELADGYAFKFNLDSATLLQATQFIALERLCCPFIGFSLKLEPNATSFRLSLTGGEGIKPFIEAELGLKPQAQ